MVTIAFALKHVGEVSLLLDFFLPFWNKRSDLQLPVRKY